MKKLLIVALCGCLLAPGAVQANAIVPRTSPQGDLLDQGLWWMCHLRYEDAHRLFEQYSKENPKDPAGYFYMAASDWWHLAEDFDYSLPAIETRFYSEADQTIDVSKQAAKSADSKLKAEAYLYWGGAEGLRGRWLEAQKRWMKAYFAGQDGERYLHTALKYNPELYDAYMGLGIYDYFTATLPGVVGALSGLLIHGDRERGFQELQMAIEKSWRARVEAKIFLIEIYTSEEDTAAKALPIAEELRQEFPLSPAMHLAHVMSLYGMTQWEGSPCTLLFGRGNTVGTPRF